MKIRYVTLTGADDGTDAKKMAALSMEYKFAEWAILFSQNKAGVERYPSLDWIDRSLPLLSETNLSAHLCGKWVSDANNGRFTFLEDDWFGFFGRIQLNMDKSTLLKVLNRETNLWNCTFDKPIILGGPYQKNIVTDVFDSHGVSPIFDCSGGRGILTDQWPSPLLGKFCGYAGGLGPDNIEEQLVKIESVVGDAEIWIDMESSLRNKDQFDLEKCEMVLSIAKRWTDI